MKIEQIKKILPHREQMLLLDEVDLVGSIAYGKKYITGEEWFLKGHFPDYPVVPGVILCEILAQSVCVCLKEQLANGLLPFFTGLNKVKIRHPVLPGDLFETQCEILRRKEPFYFAKGNGSVNGTLCISGEFSFAITNQTN